MAPDLDPRNAQAPLLCQGDTHSYMYFEFKIMYETCVGLITTRSIDVDIQNDVGETKAQRMELACGTPTEQRRETGN